MLTITMTICLLDTPSRCRDEALPVADEMLTSHQCMMMAPITVAQWADAHPQWSVQRWQCGPVKREAAL